MSKQSRRKGARHKASRRKLAAKSVVAREGEAAARRMRVVVIPAHLEGAVIDWPQDRIEEVFGVPA